jgi:hypothetical protein
MWEIFVLGAVSAATVALGVVGVAALPWYDEEQDALVAAGKYWWNRARHRC